VPTVALYREPETRQRKSIAEYTLRPPFPNRFAFQHQEDAPYAPFLFETSNPIPIGPKKGLWLSAKVLDQYFS
jgi:hypothetical protein